MSNDMKGIAEEEGRGGGGWKGERGNRRCWTLLAPGKTTGGTAKSFVIFRIGDGVEIRVQVWIKMDEVKERSVFKEEGA